MENDAGPGVAGEWGGVDVGQTVIGLTVIVGYAVAVADPVVRLFYLASTSGALGVLLLLFTTGISVLEFFIADRRGEPLRRTRSPRSCPWLGRPMVEPPLAATGHWATWCRAAPPTPTPLGAGHRPMLAFAPMYEPACGNPEVANCTNRWLNPNPGRSVNATNFTPGSNGCPCSLDRPTHLYDLEGEVDNLSRRVITQVHQATDIDAVHSLAMPTTRLPALVAGFWASLPPDYFLRTTGRGDLQVSGARAMPVPDEDHLLASALLLRTLRLNCLTSAYADLWAELYDAAWSATERWACPPGTAGHVPGQVPGAAGLRGRDLVRHAGEWDPVAREVPTR